MLFNCFVYILWISPDKVGDTVVGFGLPLEISSIIALVLTIAIMVVSVWHGYRLQKRFDFHPDDPPVYPENMS